MFLQVVVSKERDKGALAFFQKSVIWNYFGEKNKRRQVVGCFNSSLYKIANWIENNVHEDKGLFFSWYTDARAAYFLTKGANRVKEIPFTWFNLKDFSLKEIEKYKKCSLAYGDSKRLNDIIFISSQQGSPNPRNKYLWVLYESCFVDNIIKDNIRYVVVGKNVHFLYKYLDKSPYFAYSASFHDSKYKIYRVVNKPQPTNHDIYITRRTLTWLKNLKKKDPELFYRFKRIGFKKQVGIPPQMIESLATESLPENFVEVCFKYREK